MKRITSKDVAKLAGVSQSTVSRVLNPSSDREVKEDIKAKVLYAADKLGYKPNIIARSLVSRKTNIVGVVIADPIGPFYSKIITLLTSKLQERGAQPLFFTLESGFDIRSIMDKVMQYQLDGVIITSSVASSEESIKYIRNKMPIVLFNMKNEGKNVSSVYSDNIEAGELVAKLLVNTGHKRITFVTYHKQVKTTIDRQNGFYRQLQENEITDIKEEKCDYSYEDGYKLGQKMIFKEEIPDAIFCVSDLIAMGIIDAIKRESNLKIPQDVSIVGFDDIPQASWKAYELTTIHQPINRLVKKTVDVLFDLLNNPESENVNEKVSPNLVIRKSTKEII